MSIQLDNFRLDKVILKRILDFLPYPFLVAEFRHGNHANLYVNQKFRDEIGYTIEDIPTIDDWFEKAYPDAVYRQDVMRTWGMRYRLAQREKDDSAMMKAIIHTKHRGDMWFEVKSSIFGRVQLVAFINIDEEVTRARELKRLNENKNKTLSILSHDLRGPIANLYKLSQLAMNHQVTQEEFITLVKSVNEKTFQTLEFLDTALLWTKSNFDDIGVEIGPVDLAAIVESIFFIYDDSFKAKRLNVTSEFDKDVAFVSDPGILTIVIRNLISNAIKFTPDGGSIAVRYNRTPGKHIISIHDSGIGMSPETVQAVLADSYYSQKGTHEEKGLGIGLKICRDLLRRVKGELSIQSTPGRGTSMSIVLTD